MDWFRDYRNILNSFWPRIDNVSWSLWWDWRGWLQLQHKCCIDQKERERKLYWSKQHYNKWRHQEGMEHNDWSIGLDGQCPHYLCNCLGSCGIVQFRSIVIHWDSKGACDTQGSWIQLKKLEKAFVNSKPMVLNYWIYSSYSWSLCFDGHHDGVNWWWVLLPNQHLLMELHSQFPHYLWIVCSCQLGIFKKDQEGEYGWILEEQWIDLGFYSIFFSFFIYFTFSFFKTFSMVYYIKLYLFKSL